MVCYSGKKMKKISPHNAIKNTAFLISLFAYGSSAYGMELKDFVSDSIKADPYVLEQIHVHQQAIQDEGIARAGYLPSVDFTAVTEDWKNRPTDNSIGSTTEGSITLTQNLFNGFDTWYAQLQTEARTTSAVHRIHETADNQALDAIQAYLNVLSEYQQLTLAKQNVKNHEKILAQLQEQSSGVTVKLSDIEQTEGRLASARSSYVNQQNNLQDALTEANKLLGRNIDPATLVDPVPPGLPEGDVEDLIKKALAEHPALKSAQYNIEAVKNNYKRGRSPWYPTIDLQLNRSVGHNVGGIAGAEEEQSILVSLQYNLYNGHADVSELKRRIAAIHEQDAFRSRVHRQVVDALRLSWTADKALHEQLPYLRTHVERASTALEYYYEEFLLNKRDLLDVLDAESELNTAQKDEISAIYDAIAARYRVYEGMGKLFPALGLQVEIGEKDLQIADIGTNNIYSLYEKDTGKPGYYTPKVDPDFDKDKVLLETDTCANSEVDSTVNEFGCVSKFEPDFRYVSFNNPPTASDDSLTTVAGQALDIAPTDLLGNDSDADGDRLKIDEYSEPGNGSIILDAEGYLIYSPNEGFTGTDTFTYTTTDSYGGTSTATVTIQVGAPNSGN
jgi:adhesin transport system outer membrane protein